MPKVLFTASTYSHIVQFHRPYLAAFRQRGWTVEVACGGVPMDIPEANRVVDVPFEKEMLSPRNAAAWRKLRWLMKEEQYDLVSCHTALAAFFTRMAIRGLRVRPRVACMVHGYLFGEENPAAKGLILKAAAGLSGKKKALTKENRDRRLPEFRASGGGIRAKTIKGRQFI